MRFSNEAYLKAFPREEIKPEVEKPESAVEHFPDDSSVDNSVESMEEGGGDGNGADGQPDTE